MNHPNVIEMYEYFESPKYISIIYNPAPGKPVLIYFKENPKQFTAAKVMELMLQLGRAVRHLKAKDIIWCNLSHNNIIYDGEQVTICGFSSSRIKIKRTFNIDKKVLGPKGNKIKIYQLFCFLIFVHTNKNNKN